MAVHGRLALPHEILNNSRPSRPLGGAGRCQRPPPPVRPGVLLGVLGELGVPMPWGIDNPPACASLLWYSPQSPSLLTRTRPPKEFLRAVHLPDSQ
jgi:hypothetical protein